MKFKLSALLATIFFTANANALEIPKSSHFDSRVQVATYSPNQVYKITAKVGHSVLIQLEEDERLNGDSSSLGMGDSEGWSLGVRGNNILFKPLVEKSNTNLIVTTNKRTYIFEVSIDENSKRPTYVLRFNYPDTALRKRQQQDALEKQAQDIVRTKPKAVFKRNQDYWGYGDEILSPTALYDDGLFTYFEFNNNHELPTVYKVMPDGTESLVNVHIDGYTLVVQELAESFVLRLGDSVLGIDNRGFGSGAFNYRGTSQPDAVRIVK